MIMQRTSTTMWTNTSYSSYGTGFITSESKVLEKLKVSHNSRYADEIGTNPEELISAAQSSCITLVLTKLLRKAGFNEIDIKTHCTIKFDVDRIIESKILIEANVPNMDEGIFEQFVNKAKEESLIAQVLKVKTIVDFNFTSKAITNDGIAILGRSLPY